MIYNFLLHRFIFEKWFHKTKRMYLRNSVSPGESAEHLVRVSGSSFMVGYWIGYCLFKIRRQNIVISQ